MKMDEAPLVVRNEVVAAEMIAKRFQAMLLKADFKKMQKMAQEVGIKLSLRGKKYQVEDMGTVTGPHIAGTGDDSDTVVVRKKKKKKTIYGILRRARQK